ncbi:hypothetical protein CSV79_15470 [Sporosarcina sp. P13]|uniref:hypothetical protein n=1 Tax=Sporosarcina sp. P13 TaxID=2048263 RepID=UPI000C17281D|nr:hypothetical protein [Sporosarcina sp. P13]PIC62745.1 hypothetical protein CSV79_15470 [Sporosarcina sp. P13]
MKKQFNIFMPILIVLAQISFVPLGASLANAESIPGTLTNNMKQEVLHKPPIINAFGVYGSKADEKKSGKTVVDKVDKLIRSPDNTDGKVEEKSAVKLHKEKTDTKPVDSG